MDQNNNPGQEETLAAAENQPKTNSAGLPWGFVAAAAAGFFLWSNLDKVTGDGGFIYIIGAVVLGVLSANNLARK